VVVCVAVLCVSVCIKFLYYYCFPFEKGPVWPSRYNALRNDTYKCITMTVRVTFINGIRTNEANCILAAQRISELFGTKCYHFWNPTSGAVLDLSQANLYFASYATTFTIW
jgi:hypothetical protein